MFKVLIAIQNQCAGETLGIQEVYTFNALKDLVPYRVRAFELAEGVVAILPEKAVSADQVTVKVLCFESSKWVGTEMRSVLNLVGAEFEATL